MARIEFTRKIVFNQEGNFFDDHPVNNDFYEHKYLTITPSLHEENLLDKTKIIKKIIGFLMAKHGLKPQKIIDIGSGSTLILRNTLKFLSSLGYEHCFGLAIDLSTSILQSSLSYEKICKLRADASSLPVQDKSFDVLLMVDLLEHTRNPSKVIKEALRVATYVIIKTPIELSLYTLFRGGRARLCELEKKYGHIQHFNRHQLKDLIGSNRVLWESYAKIPDRTFLIDLLQSILLKFKLHALFRGLFGGFIILVLTNKNP
ncbi:class I SAM-dependent methyltransferase [Patescibacteria group bacterium]|nr:class I SAM-dependent methyltransferase [Patescibacteria group bacterium]